MRERPKFTPEPGAQYRRWTVIGGERLQNESNPKSARQTLCLCECGTRRWVSIPALKSGKSVSCGCWAKEQHSKFIKRYQALPKTFTNKE